MERKFFLLCILIASLTSMGAGCSTKLSETPTTSAYVSSIENPVTTSDDGYDTLAVSAVIEPGVIQIKSNSGTLITTSTQTYMDALSTYGTKGLRFQFARCSGNPGSLNIKKGVKFMLDNRDSQAHKIGIGSQKYQLQGYDFAVVSITKVGSYIITCDGGGSAQVGVEN